MVKTRETRRKNATAARLNDVQSGRFLGIVPKSMALADHCKFRNYGTSNDAYVQRRLHGMLTVLVRKVVSEQ